MTAALSALDPLVLLLDAQGYVLRWSRSFRSRVPQPLEALQGKRTLEGLFQQRDAQRIESILADGAKNGETADQSWHAETDDKPILWTVLIIANPSGVMEFAVVTGVEQEASPERISSRPSYSRLLGSSPFEMWAFDRATYRFLAVNEAAAREHGYSQGELRSRRVLDIWPWEEVPRLVVVVTELASGQSARRCGRHRRKDGTVFHVESEAVAAESDGQPVCLVLSQVALDASASGLRA